MDKGRNVVYACEAWGVEVIKCNCHRANSAVMWSLGISSAAAALCNIKSMRRADEKAGSVCRFYPPLRRQQRHAEGIPEAGGEPPLCVYELIKRNDTSPGLPPNTSSGNPPSTRSANQENDTEDTRMSPRDKSTMKMAIQSGGPKAVDDFMERLSDARAVHELTTTYGGGHFILEADEDDLFTETSPILHAARSGNFAVFESVMKAMQAKLSREKVKEMLGKRDIKGQSLLSLAARGGSRDVLEGVLWVIRQEFPEYEVKEMLAERDGNGVSPVEMAARSGSKDVLKHVFCVIRELFENENVLAGDERAAFTLLASAVRSGSMDVVEHVILAIRQEFSENAVNEILQSEDSSGATLPACAASSGSSNIFKTVLNLVTGNLEDNKVKGMLTSKDKTGASVLARAVESKRRGTFKAVLHVVNRDLTFDEVKTILTSRDTKDRSLLALAIKSESVEMFRIVMKTVSEKLADGEKRDMLMSKDHEEASLLALASSSGNKNTFEIVLESVKSCLTEYEVKSMLTSKDKTGATVLARAVKSKCRDTFEAVLHVINRDLTIIEMKKELRAKDDVGRSLLMHAAESGRGILFEAVLATLRSNLPEEQIKKELKAKDEIGRSLLMHAAKSGRGVLFKAVLDTLRFSFQDEQVKEMISRKDLGGERLLHHAIGTGRVEMFKAVTATLSEKLDDEEVKEMILSGDDRGTSFLARVIATGRAEMFRAVMATVSDKLTKKEVARMLREKDVLGNSVLVSTAISPHSNDRLFEAVLETVRTHLPAEEMLEQLCSSGRRIQTPIDEVIEKGSLVRCATVLRVAQDNLVDREKSSVREMVAEALDASFLWWAYRYQQAREYKRAQDIRICKRVLSMLFRHSAYPRDTFFQRIAHDVTGAEDREWQHFMELVLSGVESAENPLVPGMAVSVALAEAAEGAREGEQRMFSSFQERVDSLMLKILERLPQTVRGFEQGMSQCSALFEPEGSRNDPCGRPGPLRIGFGRREQTKTLCAIPLLMDYLYRGFMNGLPDMRDSGRVLQNVEELQSLAEGEDEDGFILGYTFGEVDWHFSDNESARHLPDNAMNCPPPGDLKDVGFFRVWLQGANASRPSLTILPGAQFIIAGILAKPNSYYRVPALRMALDFIVYITMLAAYSAWVLLHEDGPLTSAEIIFAFYVLGAALKEGREIGRDFDVYLQDRWNVLDVLAIGILAGGFSIRLADSGHPWGRAFYALSAPLVFSRALFYAQYLPFQGPMVEVIFGMTLVLLQFIAIVLVILMGFAFALFPLLRDGENFTFGDVLLLLFKALLGDLEAFEEFDDNAQNHYSSAGQLLLILYLVVMTIMLLNLLIAVLSTAHAKIERNADKELEVSKVRIVEHYRLVVALDILPAPFNLVQFVLTLPFLFLEQRARRSKIRRAIDRTVGQIFFWIILSPVAVAAGIILWIASSVCVIFFPATELASRVPTASHISDSLLKRAKVQNPFTRAALASLGVYSLIFPDRESLRSAKRLAIIRAVRLRIGVGGFCALSAPLCLLFLWLREPCLWIFRVTTALMTLLRFEGGGGATSHTHPSVQDNAEPNARNMPEAVSGVSHPSRQDSASAKVHSMLKSVGVGAGDLQKYLKDPMIDPEVRPDEVERGATVEHIKLLRNLLEKRFRDLDKKNSERFDLLKDDLFKILRGDRRFVVE